MEPMRRLVLPALLLAAACGPRPAPAASGEAAELTRLTRRYVDASRDGDAHALAALYDEHAMLLPPAAEAVEGRDAIERYWSDGLEAGLVVETARIEASGDVGYTIGRWALPATDTEDADSGKLVLCWKRTGGTWKLTADIWNSSTSPDSGDDSGDAMPGRIPVT